LNSISHIYLDMDGVISDFVKRYKELFDISPEQTRDDKEFGGFFDKFIADCHFETLELMPQAMLLIDFLRSLPIPTSILSSTASENRYEAISKQKISWLKKHDIEFTPIFVPGKQNKYKYAKPDTLIIDDTISVIDDWRKAGGVAIWHNTANGTVAMLKHYVSETPK